MKQPWLALSCIALSVAASAQTFEVATVKPAAPGGPIAGIPDAILNSPVGDKMRFRGGPGSQTPDRIDYLGVTLKMLLQRAFDLKSDQISGPGWFDNERYDIAAKLPAGTNAEQLRPMLQQLLTERFQIVMHRETKTLRVYLLTVAKGGPKLKPPVIQPEYKDDEERKAAHLKALRADIQALAERNQASGPFSVLRLPNSSVAMLTQTLASRLDRPVVDKTGLEGLYSFTLDWVPDGTRSGVNIPATGPSIYAALEEQLGLHLQAENEQLEVLVIDKAEKSPTSN